MIITVFRILLIQKLSGEPGFDFAGLFSPLPSQTDMVTIQPASPRASETLSLGGMRLDPEALHSSLLVLTLKTHESLPQALYTPSYRRNDFIFQLFKIRVTTDLETNPYVCIRIVPDLLDGLGYDNYNRAFGGMQYFWYTNQAVTFKLKQR